MARPRSEECQKWPGAMIWSSAGRESFVDKASCPSFIGVPASESGKSLLGS